MATPYPAFGSLIAAMTSSRPGGLAPVGDELAADIEAAITTRFAAAADLVTLAPAIFQGQAGDTSTLPYIVFRVTASPMSWVSSTSYWDETRIRFECYGQAAEQASAMAQALVNAFDGGTLSFEAGVSTPLILADRSKAAGQGRAKGNVRVFRATVDYGCKTRLGRP